MSYPVGPNITPYGRPPNTDSRRAGMLVLALGCVALVVGLFCALAVALSQTMEQNPEYAARMDEIRRQTQIDPRILIGIMAGMLIAYAVAAIPLGLLCRRGRLPWLITTLVLVICAGLFMAVSTIANVLSGNGVGALLPALTALHGLAAGWLISALRHVATTAPAAASLPPGMIAAQPPIQPPAPTFTLPPPPQPMQDYYLPIPPPPAPRPPKL